MLEIDNRYPEYARPYEPIKGRRRHGRLTGNESAFMAQRRLRRLDMTRRGFLTGVGILIVITVLIPDAKVELNLPKVEPIVIQIDQPVPEPEVITEPEDIPIIIPDEEPTPTPTPDPKPKPDPDEPDKKKAPVVDLKKAVLQPDGEIYLYPTLFFTMKLNDLKGGKAVGRVYVDTGSGFYEPDDSVTVVYNPSSTSGDEWSDEISCVIHAPAKRGIAGKAKIVFDIVYHDGKKAKMETDTRPVHAGSFAYFNEAFGSGGWEYGEIIDGGYYMKFDVIIDDSLIVNGSQLVPANVIDNGQHLMFWGGNASKEQYSEAGVYHIVYTYTSDTDFPSGSYLFWPELSYKEDDDNSWEPDDLYVDFVKP